MTIKEIYIEKYKALPPASARIVELMAYACCPVRKSSLEELYRFTHLPLKEFKQGIAHLNNQTEIWESYNLYYTPCYSLNPYFSLSLLVYLHEQQRNIVKEIPVNHFWEAANRLGKHIRNSLLDFYQHKITPSYETIENTNEYSLSLLYATLHLEEFKGIEAIFPETGLLHYTEALLFNEINVLCPSGNIEKLFERLSQIYSDHTFFHQALEELSFIPLLLQGHLKEITGKSAESATGCYVQGMCRLYAGEYPLAIKYFEKGVKIEKDYSNLVMPLFPLFNYGYAMALILDHSEKSDNRIRNLFKRRLIQEDDVYVLVRILFANHQGLPRNEIVNIIKNARLSLSGPLANLLACILLHYYEFPLSSIPAIDPEVLKKLEKLGWQLLLLEAYSVFPEQHSLAISLQENIGTTALITREVRIPEWEKVLNNLLPASWEKTSATKQQTSRIIYILNPLTEYIQPILQQSKDGVHWSKGRNVAIKRFTDGSLTEMNETDKKISGCVKQEHYYRGCEYTLDYAKAVICLVGYPHVYSWHNPEIPVEITEEQPQLILQKVDKGYRFSTNVPVLEDKVQIIVENPTRIKVLKLTSEQKRILESLHQINNFPEEARPQLLRLQEYLNSIITVHSDLIEGNNNLKTIQADSRVVVQLLPLGTSLRAEIFIKPFTSTPPYCKAGKGAGSVIGSLDGENCLAIRNPEEENKNTEAVQQLLEQLADIQDDEDIYLFTQPMSCLELLDALQTHVEQILVEWPEGVRYQIKRQVSFEHLSVSLTGMKQWFEVEGELRIDDETVLSMQQLLEGIRHSEGRFIPLGEGEYIALSKELKKRLSDLEAIATVNKGNVRIQQFASTVFNGWQENGVQLKTDPYFVKLQEKLQQAETLNIVVPPMLKAELRTYQVTGFEWMVRLNTWGAGGCLADDMGLGKTVQTIAMLLHVAPQGPSLVICPASVQPNWMHELERFAPSLRVLALNQTVERKQLINTAAEFCVVLATYGLLVTEETLLTEKHWQMAVLDEAHTIKNRETKMSKSAMQLTADFRLLLTGTPIQNHLGEIWNLFQFINPGLLGPLENFNEKYIVPIVQYKDKQRQTQLKRLLSPFLLRRTKTNVLDELPPKTEILKEVVLSETEMACYEVLRKKAEETLQNATGGEHLKMIAEITRLRMAACNINLARTGLPMQASKVEAFLGIVGELQDNHHQALVFSQFTSHLALIRKELDLRHIPYLYLDGSTPIRERERLVRTFQSGQTLLFLISLKAGGLGLNLTAADYVIHMDPWWNPAIEDQASDRAHRIGQVRPVTIYHLISKGTIEEKIVRLHHTKKDLADSLLEGSDISARLTREEILELIRQQ